MKRGDKRSLAVGKRYHGNALENAIRDGLASGRSRRKAPEVMKAAKALTAVHETAQGLCDAGVIDNRTMKAFDAICLTPKRHPRRARRQPGGNL